MDSSSREHPVIAVHRELSRLLSNSVEVSPQQENPRKVAFFLERIQTLLLQLDTICSDEELTPPISTALQGILNDLYQLSSILLLYKSKSRLYLLIQCRSLNERLNTLVYDIANCLTLLILGLHHDSELYKKINDLSFDLRQTQFRVSDIEDRICVAIDKINDGTTNQNVQNTLILDIARVLGISDRNRNQLFLQIELLKRDIQDSRGDHDIQVVDYLEQVFRDGSVEEEVTTQSTYDVIEENEPIPSFKTFICPLSKEVMKTPVVLETDQTYEQTEIEKWFKHCQGEGRQPTCPVTGQILRSLEWRINRVLQKTIEEWLDRNYKIRISKAKQKLQVDAFKEDFEQAIEEVQRLSEESPINKHTLRDEGLISLLLRPWEGLQKDCSHVRTKALIALHSMALENEENKMAMVEANAVKCAVKSLTSRLEREKERAAWLLLELSSQPQISAWIGRVKGAILLLSGQADNVENAVVSNLADQILRRLEKEPSNVIPMAEAGRLKPLLDCLCEGSGEIRLQMCKHLAQMTLSNSDKELAVRRAAMVLIEMLSYDVAEKESALKTLLMFSTPDDNAIVLVNSGILPPLFNLLQSVHPMSHTLIIQLKETAAEILANLVSKPGHWEVAVVDSDGNTLQSEFVIHHLLQLMTRVGYKWKPKLLQLVYCIASSPQAADAAVPHIQSGGGVTKFVVFMQESEVQSRLYALMLLSILSSKIGADVAAELQQSGQFVRLIESLQDTENSLPEERAAVACILANIPLTDTDIVQKLKVELLSWTIASLKESWASWLGKSGSTSMKMMEGLLGLLLQFCRSSNPSVLIAIQEYGLMMVFKEHLVYPGHLPSKKLAAEGLKMLSQKAVLITRNNADPSPSYGCFSAFAHLCRSTRPQQSLCHVHGIHCEANTTFCLVEANAIGPLVKLFEEDDLSVQLAAVEALSTLLDDSNYLRGGVEELMKEKGIERIFDLFCKARPGELQYRTLCMIERMIQVEEVRQRYSLDQVLTKALVQAYKAGSQTRNLSQTVLTGLKQLSAVSSGAGRARPLTRDHRQ